MDSCAFSNTQVRAVQKLYVDGGCSNNGQTDMALRRMVSVVTTEDGTVLAEEREAGGSNNIAELIAVHCALLWCAANDISAVEVVTDSRNNLSWVNGTKVGKGINDRGRVLALKAAIAALRRKVSLRLTWVPREQNVAGHYIEAHYGL